MGTGLDTESTMSGSASDFIRLIRNKDQTMSTTLLQADLDFPPLYLGRANANDKKDE
jgi:hypothetical protein